MAITVNSGGSTVGTGTGSADTLTVTGVTTTGSNRVGYVSVVVANDPFFGGSVTLEWGSGNTMTQVGSFVTNGNDNLGLFKYINPPTAATDIILTGGTVGFGILSVVAFSVSDNDQTVPTSTPDTGTGNPPFSVSSGSGEIAFYSGFYYGGGSPGGITLNSPATEIGSTIVSGQYRHIIGWDTGASPSVDFDASNYNSTLMNFGVSFRPVSGGGGGGTSFIKPSIFSPISITSPAHRLAVHGQAGGGGGSTGKPHNYYTQMKDS